MAIIRNIRIAMSADSKGFVKPVAQVNSTLDKFNTTINKTKSALSGVNFGAAGAKFAAGFTAIRAGLSSLGALGGFFAEGIKSAASLGESMSKVSNVFGDSAAGIVAQAESMAKAFGLPKGALIDAASQFGLLGKGVGQTKEQAANMSKVLVQMAGDAMSFHDVDLDVAIEKLGAGIRGESEPLSKFGMMLKEDAVKAEGLAMGLVKVGQEMNEQAKMTARMSLIQKGMADADNDLFETQDGLKNQWRKLTGSLENFATDIGTMLLPALQEGIVILNVFKESVIATFENNKPIIMSWVESIKSGFQTIGFIFRNFSDIWAIAQLNVTQAVGNMLANFDALIINLGMVADYIAGNWLKAIADGVSAVQAVFANLGHNIGEYMFAVFHALTTGEWVEPMTKPLLEGFKATIAQIPMFVKPAMVDLSKDIEDRMNNIAKNEKALADKVAKGPAEVVEKEKLGDLGGGAEAKKKKKGKEEKGAGALELGSQEAGSAVAKILNRTVDDKPAKDTAANTSKTASELIKTNNILLNKLDALKQKVAVANLR